jgi:hypothetical protein
VNSASGLVFVSLKALPTLVNPPPKLADPGGDTSGLCRFPGLECYIIFFFVTGAKANQARMFVPDKPFFQHGLLFAGKALPLPWTA